MTTFDSKLFTWAAAILVALVLSLGHLLDLPSDDHIERATALSVADLADDSILPTPQYVFANYSRTSYSRIHSSAK